MKQIGWWNTELGDKELTNIINAFQNRNIGMGVETQALEDDICKLLHIPYSVIFPSCSVALYVALKVNGIKPDDEVIVPNRTFIATAHAVLLAGAKVKLVDANSYNTNIDVSKIIDAITPKTRAIIPVHLNGCGVDMGQINLIAEKYNLIVIEDASQALLSKNKKGDFLGTLSSIGCYSLGLAKLISMGYGGFCVCHDKETYDKLVKFRNHGSSQLYAHEGFGFNFKVSDLLSSMCRAQIARANEKINKVKEIYQLYSDAITQLDYIDLINVDIANGELPLYIEVRSKFRENIIEFLKHNGISTQILQQSLHTHKHLFSNGYFPNSETFDKELFRLPCGPSQGKENVLYVIEALKRFKI